MATRTWTRTRPAPYPVEDREADARVWAVWDALLGRGADREFAETVRLECLGQGRRGEARLHELLAARAAREQHARRAA